MQGNAAFEELPSYEEAKKNEIHQASILFTTQDLLRIKSYVRDADALKTEHHEIAKSLGVTTVSLSTALLNMIAELNTAIKNHAGTWPTLESDSKQLGVQLASFSDRFLSTIDDVVNAIKKTNAYDSFESTVGDIEALMLTPSFSSEHEGLQEQVLNDDDKNAPFTLVEFLLSMKQDVADYQQKVDAVYELAQNFAKELEYGLPGLLRNVQEEVAKINLEQQIIELDAAADQLGLEIGEKEQEVAQYASYWWMGAVFGPLGLGLSHFTIGSIEREAQAKLDKLHEAQLNNRIALAKLHPLKGRIRQYREELLSVRASMKLTKEAAQKLKSVWADIDAVIDDSQLDAKRISNTMGLLMFLTKMKRIRMDWKKTKAQSEALNKVFNDFLKEYETKSMEGEFQ